MSGAETTDPPQSTVRATVTGFVALGAATLLAQVINFVALTAISRRLGPEGLGAFTFAVNLVGYFAIPANFGVTTLAIRDIARDPDRARHVAGEVLALQTLLCVLPYAALVALAPVLAPDAASEKLLPVVGLVFIVEAFALQWVLFARQRYTAVAVSRVVGAVVFAVLVFTLLDDGAEPLTLGWFHILGGVATGLVTVVAVLRIVRLPHLRVPPRRLLTRFRAGIALGISAVMISVYSTIGSVMLGYLEDTATVGQYAVAYRLPLAIIAFAGLWSSVIYPHFSTVFARSTIELREQLGWFTSLALVASLPLLAGAIVVGPDLMPRLFGAEYEPAGTPFVLLTATAALALITINWGAAQIAAGDERYAAIAVTLGAAACIVLNLAAIPLFGMAGAAAATIAAELVVLGYTAARVQRLLGRVPFEWPRIGRTAIATAIMTVVIVALPGTLDPIAVVGIGLVVFVLAALPLRVVRTDELRQLLPR